MPLGLGMPSLLQADLGRFQKISDTSGLQQQSVFDRALQQYPVLQGLGLQFNQSQAADPLGSQLEFWPPGEPGSPDRPRPQDMDPNKPGIQVFSDKVRPIDILGDVVSHHLIENDPKVSQVYDAFKNSITPQQEELLKRQYLHARENNKETRDFETWKERSGIPAFFRGHPFQQWPTGFNQKVYTPQQMQLLDRMMNYLQSAR